MFFLTSIFVTLIYQPFFNLLVGIYLLLDYATKGNADMGIAVILFTVAFRIVWLPISLASGRSYKEEKQMLERIADIKATHSHDPISRKSEIKKVFYGNRRTVIMTFINIGLQFIIALMLWRIFARGLGGEDFHLLYPFMPEITEPFDLTFLGKYDLTHSNMTLNFIQSLAIFVFEALSALFSVSRSSARDVVMTQLVLPFVSFFIFLTLPAGKKLFIITTLLFSIIQMIVKQIYFTFRSLSEKLSQWPTKMKKPPTESSDKNVIPATESSNI